MLTLRGNVSSPLHFSVSVCFSCEQFSTLARRLQVTEAKVQKLRSEPSTPRDITRPPRHYVATDSVRPKEPLPGNSSRRHDDDQSLVTSHRWRETSDRDDNRAESSRFVLFSFANFHFKILASMFIM